MIVLGAIRVYAAGGGNTSRSTCDATATTSTLAMTSS
jgi:hypothetical protein